MLKKVNSSAAGVVRPSITERRPLWFCATCEITALSRCFDHQIAAIVSPSLSGVRLSSAPSVIGCGGRHAARPASAACPSAWSEGAVVTVPTIKPLRFSISA
jgi:hypothetical protein